MRLAPGEGDPTGGIHPITIRNFDKEIWVDEELVAKARSILSSRCGVPIGEALAEIDLRLPSQKNSATISRYAPNRANEAPGDEEEDVLRDEKSV